MFLAVDVGNTNIKCGAFADDRLTHKLTFATSVDDYRRELTAIDQPIETGLICSVVPSVVDRLITALTYHFPTARFRQITNSDEFELSVSYDLTTAGTDRLVNCFAATEMYGVPVVVCSFGTATTIDVVDASRTWTGGVIAPGPRLMAESLAARTSQLPQVNFEGELSTLGGNTVEAIRSGILNTQIGLLQEVLKSTGEKAAVVATGGAAELIATHTHLIDHVDPDLLLWGLFRIHRRGIEQ
jgi:type III pantothenate kinase